MIRKLAIGKTKHGLSLEQERFYMKKNPIYKLKVSSHFSSSHQLRNYKGKCENLHGHNFIVEVIVRGSMLDKKVEYLIDFKILKKIIE